MAAGHGNIKASGQLADYLSLTWPDDWVWVWQTGIGPTVGGATDAMPTTTHTHTLYKKHMCIVHFKNSEIKFNAQLFKGALGKVAEKN